MQPSNVVNDPKVFLVSLFALALVVCGLSVLRDEAKYVNYFDIVLCAFALFFATWLIALWRHKRNIYLNDGFIANRLRFIVLICMMGPFIYLFITAANDLSARRMQLCSDGIEDLRASEDVRQVLGSPLVVAWPIGLSGEYSSDSGHAVLLIPIRGSRNKADVYVNGRKNNGAWSIKEIYLAQDGAKPRMIPIPASTPQ